MANHGQIGVTHTHIADFLRLMGSLEESETVSDKIFTLEKCSSAVMSCSDVELSTLMKQSSIDKLSTAVQHVLQAVIVPPFVKRDYFSYSEGDFEHCSELTEAAVSLISELLSMFNKLPDLDLDVDPTEEINDHGSTTMSTGSVLDRRSSNTGPRPRSRSRSTYFSWLYECLSNIMIVIGAHLKCSLWSSVKSQQKCNILLQQLLNIHNVSSVSDLLCSKTKCDQGLTTEDSAFLSRREPENVSLFAQLMHYCKVSLSKDQWQRNPFLAEAFAWTVLGMKMPNLSDHIDQIMVTSLNFIDDHQINNKIRGIDLMHHLLLNTSTEEMRWFNRAEVIYESLKHQLYTKEAEMLQQLLPCLRCLLQIVEPGRNNIELIRHHEVYGTLLREAEGENLLAIRRVYMDQLSDFTELMGIGCVRHLRTLVSIIEQYLEVEDGEQEQARSGALALLFTVVTVAWPRINQHGQRIVQSLCKFLLDINSHDIAEDQQASATRSYMNAQVVDILCLLKQVVPDLQHCLVTLYESDCLSDLKPILCLVV